MQYALDPGDEVIATTMLQWLKRAIKVEQKRVRVKDATLRRRRQDLWERLGELSRLEAEAGRRKAAAQALRQVQGGPAGVRDGPRGAVREHRLGTGAKAVAISRKVTNGTRSEWGAEFFTAVRSVVGIGRLNAPSTLDAIAQSIDGRSILNPTWPPKVSNYRRNA